MQGQAALYLDVCEIALDGGRERVQSRTSATGVCAMSKASATAR